MSDSISIQPATVADLHEIASLARRIWPMCYREIISAGQIDYMLGQMYTLEQLKTDMTAGIAFDLLFEDGLSIGFTAYGSIHSEPPTCKLHKLYLLPSHQGRGYGSRLLCHVVNQARSSGSASLTLNVNKNNTAAIKVYKRHGFIVREEVQIDIGAGFIMDDYVMALAF